MFEFALCIYVSMLKGGAFLEDLSLVAHQVKTGDPRTLCLISLSVPPWVFWCESSLILHLKIKERKGGPLGIHLDLESLLRGTASQGAGAARSSRDGACS